MPTPMPSVVTSLLCPVLCAVLTGTPALDPHPATGAGASVPLPSELAPSASPGRRAEEFSWPLAGPDGPPPVIRRFQPPARPYGRGHRGVDLAGVAGQSVRSAGDGLVLFAGQVGGRGVVSVEHSDGLRTTYEPVAASVLTGRRVRRGEVIGSLVPGHGHPDDTAPTITPTRASAARLHVASLHVASLHWGARRGHEYLDPLRLLNLAPVRLLPWPAG